MQKQEAHRSFLAEMVPILDEVGTPFAQEARRQMERQMECLLSRSGREAQWYAKQVMTVVADVAQVALLYDMARSQGERYARIAELYTIRFLLHEEYPYQMDEELSTWNDVTS